MDTLTDAIGFMVCEWGCSLMQFAASALLLLPGAPPLEETVGSGRDGVADEPGHRDLRAVGVQGETYGTRRRVALEKRLQVVELLMCFDLRLVRLHRTGVGLSGRAGSITWSLRTMETGAGGSGGLRAPSGTSTRWIRRWCWTR